tara:strand:- start:1508 stop:1807 length:300 start_codon:yes stop_codon:yes gene_type:complete
MKYYFLAYKKMFDFNGKSSKKEFWNFFIIDMLIFILIGFFEGFTSYTLLADKLLFIYIAISIIPFFALGFRRLIDAGYNKYLFFIPLANLLFASMETKK